MYAPRREILSAIRLLHRQSKPRINLINDFPIRVRIPVRAGLGQSSRDVRLLDISRALDDGNIETSRDMPRNVTVQRPNARVVAIEFKNQMARISRAPDLNQLHVSALRVVRSHNSLAIPRPLSFRENPEVVTMQMHGMSGSEVIVEDDADARVGSKVIDIPFLFEGEVAFVYLLQNGDVVVGSEGLVVHVPEVEPSSIGLKSNVDLLNSGRCCRGSLRLERDGKRKIVISAGECVIGEGVLDSRWSRGLVGLGIVDWRKSFCDSTSERASTNVRPHPNSVGGLAFTVNENICSLPNTQSNYVGGIGVDRHKVICDNDHLIPIN